MKTKTILVRVSEVMEQELKKNAEQIGMTLSEYIRFILQTTIY